MAEAAREVSQQHAECLQQEAVSRVGGPDQDRRGRLLVGVLVDDGVRSRVRRIKKLCKMENCFNNISSHLATIETVKRNWESIL